MAPSDGQVRTTRHISVPARIRQGAPRRSGAEQARTRRSRRHGFATTNTRGRWVWMTTAGGQVMGSDVMAESIHQSPMPAPCRANSASNRLALLTRPWVVAAAVAVELISLIVVVIAGT